MEKPSALRGSGIFFWNGQWRETGRINCMGDVGEGLGRSGEGCPAVRLEHMKGGSSAKTITVSGCPLAAVRCLEEKIDAS